MLRLNEGLLNPNLTFLEFNMTTKKRPHSRRWRFTLVHTHSKWNWLHRKWNQLMAAYPALEKAWNSATTSTSKQQNGCHCQCHIPQGRVWGSGLNCMECQKDHTFIGLSLPRQGRILVFRFIIEYSGLRNFYRPLNNNTSIFIWGFLKDDIPIDLCWKLRLVIKL
jgi:hypothetical protein